MQSWENSKNTPSLENLEKIARMRGQLPEEFVAYLYGRPEGSRMPFDEQIESMSWSDLGQLMKMIGRRLVEKR